MVANVQFKVAVLFDRDDDKLSAQALAEDIIVRIICAHRVRQSVKNDAVPNPECGFHGI